MLLSSQRLRFFLMRLPNPQAEGSLTGLATKHNNNIIKTTRPEQAASVTVATTVATRSPRFVPRRLPDLSPCLFCGSILI